MLNIYELSARFRTAIESAHAKGYFAHDIGFDKFPIGSCGDSCYLLAEYLRGFGIETIWCSADRDGYSHAWLVVKDARVKIPKTRSVELPNNIRDQLNIYSGGLYDKSIDITRYEEADLQEGTIIDITGDQFEDYASPVYVGDMDYFHREFDFIQANDFEGLNDIRLKSLYKIIMSEI